MQHAIKRELALEMTSVEQKVAAAEMPHSRDVAKLTKLYIFNDLAGLSSSVLYAGKVEQDRSTSYLAGETCAYQTKLRVDLMEALLPL